MQRMALNVNEVARLLGCSRQAIYAMARSGALPTIRVGRRVVIPVAPLEDLLRRPIPAELLQK